jgi:hypothetical protein
MSDGVVVISWNRAMTGMEEEAAEVLQDAAIYLGAKEATKEIDGFQLIFLEPGGGLNGMIQFYGDREKLDALLRTQEFAKHVFRASVCLDDFSLYRGATGQAAFDQSAEWSKTVDRREEKRADRQAARAARRAARLAAKKP